MAEALLVPAAPSVALKGSGALKLLCACAKARPDPEEIQTIERRNGPAFDWDEFLRLGEHHGVLALVARNLTAHARALPLEIERSLDSAYAANLRRSLWFAAELMRIVQHFERKQLRALPYKGPVLAQTAYGDLGLRSFSDLDLLISPADFSQAKQVLSELGYHPSQQLPPAVERLWLRTGYERSFDGAAGKNLVELQWNLLPYFYAVDSRSADFRFDDLLARAGRTALGATEIPTEGPAGVPCLSPEDSLLVLCLHAAKHLWTRLIWITDIAESLRMPGIDFDLVIARARALGIARILGVSVWLAEHLLAAPIPLNVRNLIAHDTDVPLLGEGCAARLRGAATYDFESAQYFRQILKLRERRSDRWRYLGRLIWTPGPGDIAAVALPETMFALYRAVRVGRLLGKCVPINLRRGRSSASH
ncbi:MAG: nucleotidyltransferase family protein [Terriglobales bacterium]